MTWTKHKCISPLKYKIEPCGSLTLVGVRSQARCFYEDWNTKWERIPATYNGTEGELEYDPKATMRGEPINPVATQIAHESEKAWRWMWPRTHGPYTVGGDAFFLTDPRPRHQWRCDGEIDLDEFEEWVSLNIRSTVCGIVCSPYDQQTAITFAQLPTKSERFWLKMRWA